MSAAEEYLVLGLRLGRHVDGLVDAYYGPPELKEEVDREPVADATTLAADADALLGKLDDGWLSDQVYGLRTYAGVLAGEHLSYSDEVEGCYGVRPQRVGTEQYEAVHDRLEELLPGDGDLAGRYEAWRRSRIVPAEKVVPALRDVLSVLRERTAQMVSLPEGERAVVDEVRDEPWWAFNYYQGELCSRVVVNLDQPDLADDVVELAAHEVYPGHHTEHSVKEQLFLRERGELEESIQLVPTPAALLQEGVAETGPSVILDDATGEQLVDVFRGHGIECDLAAERRVRDIRRPLRRLGLDAALMIHEDGVPDDEVQTYLERWGLVPPEQARHTIRFVTDPTWRAYVINYSAGGELCRGWVAGDPLRFARLLTEHVRVRDLLPAVSSGE
ncbi:MAG TPA: hypothetical protein VFA24_05135 [Gaiellaceae bacterium]|nr:hypothetical protein [Gaiellaceae bacterium]